MDRVLLNYLPEFLREYREMKVLCQAQQYQAEQMWLASEKVWNNQFISTLDEYGCTRWESILGLQVKDTYSLDDRRNKILSRIVEQRPFTVRSLKRQLEVLCGEDNFILNLDGLCLTVRIGLSSKHMYDDVQIMLDRILPANIQLYYSLLYNSHDKLGQHTHTDLADYTHTQLREDVINNE